MGPSQGPSALYATSYKLNTKKREGGEMKVPKGRVPLITPAI